MTRSRAAAVACAAALLALARPVFPDGPQFSIYPSYSAKFDIGTEKFSLVTQMVVYNISGQTFTDVGFRQTYPDGVSVKETYQRDVGTEATGEQSSARKVENNVLTAGLPTFKNRMYVVIPNELVLARRLTEISFPGMEITYTDPSGQKQTTKLQDNTYDLFIYSNVVGGLERFLAKYNKITFDFAKATPNRKEWEFAPQAASSQGRFPTGIIGTFPGSDQYDGYFRLRSGPAGDNIQMVVVYKSTHKNERVQNQEALLKALRGYMRWCGEFEFQQDDLKVTQGEWKKYDGTWSVDGHWVDTVKNRLGGGVVKAKAFWGAREDVEYYVLALGHGRALGENSANPNPEKEAELGGEIDHLIESFKSNIVPLSSDKRR